MPKLFLRTGLLLCLALPVYFLHLYLILPHFDDLNPAFISFNYKFNLGLSLLFISVFYLLFKTNSSVLGFTFLTLSGFKLILYLFLVNKLGFQLNRGLFLHFFLPYLWGVGTELFFVYRLLNPVNK